MPSEISRLAMAICVVVVLGLKPTSADAQPNLVDLGATTGHAINNNGQVALDAGVYSKGTITPLPALPGQLSAGPPLAISSSGDVAGSATIPGWGFGGAVATAYIGGTAINLFSSFTGREQEQTGTGSGINSSGTVVGWIYTFNVSGPGAPIVGFNYRNGVLTQMSVPCGPNSNGNCAGIAYNYIYGINDNNQIIGSVTYQPGSYCATPDAYLYDNGVWTDMGSGSAFAVNSLGEVTGTQTVWQCEGALLQTGSYAFLYSNGTTANLGTLPGGKNSTGYAINVTGQVVGSSDLTGSTTTHAFLYNAGMNDLNSLISATDPLKPYVTLTSAVGINDSWLILVNGIDSRTNQTHAYLFQAPQIQIAPGPLSFGTQALGGTSPSQTVTLTNNGATAIALGTISASTNFSLTTNGCGASLTPGSQCSVSVAFAPAIAGALTGALTIPAAGVSYQVPLSGVSPLSATISASTSTATVGKTITITWMSSPGSTCTNNFNGSNAPSGNAMLTATSAGTVDYGTHCTAPGVPEVDPATSVVWTWPAVTVTLSASPATITAGQSTTLTWNSSNATGCSATGGASGDGWTGALAKTSGSQTVPEPFVPANPSVTVTFGITCTSSASGLSANASTKVVINQAPGKSGGGGGGAFDMLAIVALLGTLVLRQPTRRAMALGRSARSR